MSVLRTKFWMDLRLFPTEQSVELDREVRTWGLAKYTGKQTNTQNDHFLPVGPAFRERLLSTQGLR